MKSKEDQMIADHQGDQTHIESIDSGDKNLKSYQCVAGGRKIKEISIERLCSENYLEYE